MNNSESFIAWDSNNVIAGTVISASVLIGGAGIIRDVLPAWVTRTYFGAAVFCMFGAFGLSFAPVLLWRRRHIIRVRNGRLEYGLLLGVMLTGWRPLEIVGWRRCRRVEEVVRIFTAEGETIEMSIRGGHNVIRLVALLESRARSRDAL